MPKANAIGTPITTHSADQADEEDDQVEVAERQRSSGRSEPQRGADHGDQRERGRRRAPARERSIEARQRDHHHQHRADADRRDALRVVDLERRA